MLPAESVTLDTGHALHASRRDKTDNWPSRRPSEARAGPSKPIWMTAFLRDVKIERCAAPRPCCDDDMAPFAAPRPVDVARA